MHRRNLCIWSFSLRLLDDPPPELTHEMPSICRADIRVVARAQLPTEIIQCATQIVAFEARQALEHGSVGNAAHADANRIVRYDRRARDQREIAMTGGEFGEGKAL